MAGASLFALLDDIATILDDVAALSKVAAKKTAGIVGDDLAVNALISNFESLIEAILVDGVDGGIVDQFVERNPEDWSAYES